MIFPYCLIYCLDEFLISHSLNFLRVFPMQAEFGECGRPRIGWQIDPFGHAREHAHIMAKVHIAKTSAKVVIVFNIKT